MDFVLITSWKLLSIIILGNYPSRLTPRDPAEEAYLYLLTRPNHRPRFALVRLFPAISLDLKQACVGRLLVIHNPIISPCVPERHPWDANWFNALRDSCPRGPQPWSAAVRFSYGSTFSYWDKPNRFACKSGWQQILRRLDSFSPAQQASTIVSKARSTFARGGR